MSQARYQPIDALRKAVLKIDAAQRCDFLHRACGSDQDAEAHPFKSRTSTAMTCPTLPGRARADCLRARKYDAQRYPHREL